MTSPGEDCGVKGGCHACPLFVAKVCGDPAPEPKLWNPAEAYYRMFDAPAHDPDPAPKLDELAARPRAYVCVQTAYGVVPCGSADYATSREERAEIRAWCGDVIRVDPDAPDVDPAEPKPEGSGCCGGACG